MKRWCRGAMIVLAASLGGVRAQTPAEQAGPSFALPPLDSLTATVDRPLFDPSRRGAAAGAAPAATGGAGVRLAGLVAGADGQGVALVEGPAGQGQWRLRRGGSINGWTVRAVDAGGLTLEAGGRRLRVPVKGVIPAAADGR